MFDIPSMFQRVVLQTVNMGPLFEGQGSISTRLELDISKVLCLECLSVCYSDHIQPWLDVLRTVTEICNMAVGENCLACALMAGNLRVLYTLSLV